MRAIACRLQRIGALIRGRVDDNIPFYEDFSPLAQPSYPSHTTSATGPLFLLIAVVALPFHFSRETAERCDVCGACVVEASRVPCSSALITTYPLSSAITMSTSRLPVSPPLPVAGVWNRR